MLFSSEQVSNGHPDKICDQISDAIVTDILAHDKKARIAAEVCIKDYDIIILGEITSTYIPDYQSLVMGVLRNIGLEDLDKYKVIVPESNGSGAIGEVLSTPLIGEPLIGVTQTFLTIGAFDTRAEAEACLKYVKTKFARTMLGLLKATQHNPKETWRLVPLQDFTDRSDIDWSQSVADIDRQLYRKYKLGEKEIAFIEEKVRAME